MAETNVVQIARTLVLSHGPDALPLARRAAENVRHFGMPERESWWRRVIDAIEAMQREGQSTDQRQ